MTAQDTLNNQRIDEVKWLRAAHQRLLEENTELKSEIEDLRGALARAGTWYYRQVPGGEK